MKKALLLLVVAAFIMSFVSGCQGHGVVDTYQDRMLRYRQINDLQARMLVDDWDYLWLYERNTFLSEWYPRVGN
ncbi:MAG: hypothetical protein ACYTF6_00730 [Planctomycetota bacterium]|jgi:hypothetical protein